MIGIKEVDLNKRGVKNKVGDAKREIKKEIEQLLETNKGNVLNEEEIKGILLKWLISLHNRLDLGNSDIDFFKLLREVFNTLYCEYLLHNKSKNVKYFAISIRSESDILTDYIGFKR